MIKNSPIFTFFLLAFKDILRPRIIGLLFLPFLGSAILWGAITYFLWGWLTNLGITLLQVGFIQSVIKFISNYLVIGHDPLILIAKLFFILGVILPLALITALILTSIFLVPIIVEEIRKTDFPTLVKKSNSLFSGTTATLSLSAKYFFSWVGTLPLWLLIPGGSLLVPYLLLSWFNSRLFTWEVMVEMASIDETKIFIKGHSFNLWVLGLLTSTLYFIPILNLIAPIITAAAFSRYCLASAH
jgi:hypothetical protein